MFQRFDLKRKSGGFFLRLVVLRLALVPGRRKVHRACSPKVENPEISEQPLSRLQAAAMRFAFARNLASLGLNASQV